MAYRATMDGKPLAVYLDEKPGHPRPVLLIKIADNAYPIIVSWEPDEWYDSHTISWEGTSHSPSSLIQSSSQLPPSLTPENLIGKIVKLKFTPTLRPQYRPKRRSYNSGR